MNSGKNQTIQFSHNVFPVQGRDMPESIHEKWSECLKEAEHEIGVIINSSEGEFLHIGSKLRDFENRVIQISELSSDITSVLSAEEIVHTIDSLNELLVNITTYHEMFLSVTHARIENLTRIMKIIQSIDDPLNDFKDITRTLRTLSTTTKVQSALIGTSARNFTILADDVKKLSMLIDQRVSSIINNLSSLRDLAVHTCSQLLAFEDREKINVKKATNYTESAINSLKEKYTMAKSIAAQSSSRAKDVSCIIADLVTSLQIHDITRQKFEHVRKTIHNIYIHSQGNMTGSDLPVAETSNLNTQDIIAEHNKYLIVSLNTILKEFRRTVHDIITNLIIISTNVTDIMKETMTLVKEEDAGKRTFIDEVENSLSSADSVVTSFFESAETDKRLAGTIQLLANTSREITGFVHDIKTIGEDLKLISFNSIIKAEEIGDAGTALSVIADFIKKLADDSHTKAYIVSEALESINQSVLELSLDIQNKSVVGDSDVKNLSNKLVAMNGAFHVVNKHMISLLDDIDKKGWLLASDIQNVAEGINVHITVEGIIHSVIAQCKALLKDMGLSYTGNLIQDLGAHNGFSELWMDESPLRLPWLDAETTGDFNDKEKNVELF